MKRINKQQLAKCSTILACSIITLKMKELRHILRDDYIELIRLLKLLHIAESGAKAKMMVEEGMVMVNGTVESRKRAKLRDGDIAEVEGVRIMICKD